MNRRLTAPKKWVFWTSLVVAVVASLLHLLVPGIPALLTGSLVCGAYLLLAAGVFFKGI